MLHLPPCAARNPGPERSAIRGMWRWRLCGSNPRCIFKSAAGIQSGWRRPIYGAEKARGEGSSSTPRQLPAGGQPLGPLFSYILLTLPPPVLLPPHGRHAPIPSMLSNSSQRPDSPLIVKCLFDKSMRRITFASAATCRLDALRARVSGGVCDDCTHHELASATCSPCSPSLSHTR